MKQAARYIFFLNLCVCVLEIIKMYFISCSSCYTLIILLLLCFMLNCYCVVIKFLVIIFCFISIHFYGTISEMMISDDKKWWPLLTKFTNDLITGMEVVTTWQPVAKMQLASQQPHSRHGWMNTKRIPIQPKGKRLC